VHIESHAALHRAPSIPLQTPRDDRTTSSPSGAPSNHTPALSPSPVGDAPLGKALMEAALQQQTATGVQPPLVVTPSGYWVDGTDHRHTLDSAGRALLPAQPAWQPRIDQDDTAKCYRRFFVGRVTILLLLPLISPCNLSEDAWSLLLDERSRCSRVRV